MRLVFTIEVEVERTEGLFASRDELGEQIVDELEGADLGTLEGDDGGQYETVAWSVTYHGKELPK